MRTTEPLRAAEHHHFFIGGQWLLFDTGALTVAASSELDGVMLTAARDGAPVEEIVRAAVARGAAPAWSRRRVRELRRMRFLLRPGQQPRPLPVAEQACAATFMINVSQRCNLTCPYCYVKRGQFDYDAMPVARMTMEMAAGLVARIHSCFPGFQTYGYHFYGGEPLMNFDAIRRIVEDAEATAASGGSATDFHITTNGTLLTDEVAAFFDDHRFTVYVSIDGNEESHDAYRRYANGRGSYHDVQRGVARLRSKPNVHIIGSSVIRTGFGLGEAMDLLRSHGADQCKAERVHLGDADPLTLRDEEHARYLADLEGLVDHYVQSLTSGRKPMDYRLSSKILQLLVRRRRDFFCAAGTRMFGIAADGEIYACALHTGRPQSRLGHVGEGVDPERQKAFQARFRYQEQPRCRACWSRNLCGGGCPAMVDRFGGDDCRAMQTESEAAIAVYQRMIEIEPALLYGLVSPSMAQWAAGGEGA